MTKPLTQTRPAWLRDADEFPRTADKVERWTENHMTCLYAPQADVGVYIHLSRRAGTFDLWEEQFAVTLPDGRCLISKGFSAGHVDQGITVAGVSFRVDTPFQKWTKRFHGGARLVSVEEQHSQPATDGAHIPVDLELTCMPFSLPFDYGSETLKQEWTHGHYEQHIKARGRLSFGGQTLELEGAGIQDHSWGPRDTSKIGSTCYINGQFPGSGRSFLTIHVPGVAKATPLMIAIVTGTDSIEHVKVTSPMPTAADFAATRGNYELRLDTSKGSSVIRATVLHSVRMAFIGLSEIAVGKHCWPQAHHEYVPCFTRFEWDGEVGYGMTERTVDLAPT